MPHEPYTADELEAACKRAEGLGQDRVALDMGRVRATTKLLQRRPTARTTLNTGPKPAPRDTMLKVAGKSFRCECGCNVFKKVDAGTYVCNGCSMQYTDPDEVRADEA